MNKLIELLMTWTGLWSDQIGFIIVILYKFLRVFQLTVIIVLINKLKFVLLFVFSCCNLKTTSNCCHICLVTVTRSPPTTGQNCRLPYRFCSSSAAFSSHSVFLLFISLSESSCIYAIMLLHFFCTFFVSQWTMILCLNCAEKFTVYLRMRS